MSAQLLTDERLVRYVGHRNAVLDSGTGSLPKFEVHLLRLVNRRGAEVRELAIVVGDDLREVSKIALAADYPSRTLYDAPKDLRYLGEIGITCWGKPVVVERRAAA